MRETPVRAKPRLVTPETQRLAKTVCTVRIEAGLDHETAARITAVSANRVVLLEHAGEGMPSR